MHFIHINYICNVYILADDAPEVFSARSKLDGVLQTLVDQKEEGCVSIVLFM